VQVIETKRLASYKLAYFYKLVKVT